MRPHILTKRMAVAAFIAVTAISVAGLHSAGAKSSRGAPDRLKEISAALRKPDAPIQLADEKGLPPKARGDDNRTVKLGDTKYWAALNDATGSYYVKTFRLRGTSNRAELWVATNLDFPAGDCRNDGVRNVITDQQVAYMLGQFDNNIRPIDTDWFGEPAFRDGKNALLRTLLPSSFGNGSNAYFNKQGRDVILVDNVRDDNYFDFNNEHSLPRIGGFFTAAMDDFHDRNVITIDSFDWAHATGGDPPHQPSTDPCLNMPARPFLYESTFAHEYQHLIHNDYDPDEVNWVNEGMSMLAELLTGYSDPSIHVDQKGYEALSQSFLGWDAVAHPDWNPIPRPAGPENSLTSWGDQGDLEILADYGHAFYFMTYLLGHGYGKPFFQAWQHGQANGIEGLNEALAEAGSSDDFDSIFNDVELSALADGFVDDGASVTGTSAARVQDTAENATLNINADAYATHGAPPWGSDFVPIGAGSALASVSFNGPNQFIFDSAPQFVLNNGYFAVIGPSETQYDSDLDVSIVHEVNVTGAGVLTFSHYYDTEETWDFGFVQVSTDGGQTWASLPCTGTRTDHDPGAVESVQANVPGYTGTAGSAASPIADSCDLSPYSGSSVLLAFRFISDPSVDLTGWFVKDIKLDGASVGTPGSLDGWSNEQFFDPAEIGFTLQFVGLSGDVDAYGHVTNATSVTVVRPQLDTSNDVTLSAEQLAQLAGSERVIAIISGVPEVEENGPYQPYSLLVNGVERADGQ